MTRTVTMLLLALCAVPAIAAERYLDVWGPALGSGIPVLDATDHTGRQRSVADLSGDQGLLLFLVRSADW